MKQARFVLMKPQPEVEEVVEEIIGFDFCPSKFRVVKYYPDGTVDHFRSVAPVQGVGDTIFTADGFDETCESCRYPYDGRCSCDRGIVLRVKPMRLLGHAMPAGRVISETDLSAMMVLTNPWGWLTEVEV